MSPKVSMQQIADRLGMSKYTVSQALSGKSGVSEENRLRIQETAKAMGYTLKQKQPQRTPTHYQTASHVIGDTHAKTEITPYILVWIQSTYLEDNPFWGKVLTGIAAASKELGFEHLIVPIAPHHQLGLQMPSYLDPSHCIGQLLAGTFPVQSVISLKQSGIPLVLIDHHEPLIEVDCVLNNNLDAGKMACQRLLSSSAKRVIFIGDDQFAVSFKERWWGCRMALEDMTVSGPVEHYHLKKWQIAYSGPHMLHQLERKVAALTPETMPDGFVCANDHLALALLPILKRHGLDVPSQVKVLGLDNIEAAAYATPALSTIELGKEALGIRAVETLLYRLQHPGRQVEKVVLSSRFIARNSG
ncbi:putative HTH-type transcriptional repressor ExuR [Paenibacillus allorhizoplanae]|uniref:HTH-type transcriptional repressor ExuR n=1 Tax=Paenibacillus allorhizoplanae TaxID=2905648 RepID=A0ABM9CZ19_9BACL|nr:LacI family DNA-binding transcriptional regulator [Paenibacillus allorhizoplanae]CAH1231733.1 putative HTH-type transcriptional repressor ExuR [Paenibacillus allorhizoplanae]